MRRSFIQSPITISQTFCRLWRKDSVVSVITNSFPSFVPLSVPPLLTHNERNFNEILLHGSEDMPALPAPKPICHAYFILACMHYIWLHFDKLFFSNIFSHFSTKRYLPKQSMNIHTKPEIPLHSEPWIAF